MSGVNARMRTLRGKLALVRNGVGAATMPKDVTKLTLTYSFKGNDGHLGPRKFWRQYLPRLKYHNPDVPMEVIQKQNIGGPATLVIEFKGDRKETIDVQHRHESDIIKEVIQVTKAKQLPINPEDNRLANEYLEDKQKKLVGEANKMARRAAKKEQEKLESGVTA